MLGGVAGRRRRGRQRMRWLDGITDWMDMSLSRLGSWWWTGRPGVLRFMGSQRVGHDWATELNWTELTWIHLSLCYTALSPSLVLWPHLLPTSPLLTPVQPQWPSEHSHPRVSSSPDALHLSSYFLRVTTSPPSTHQMCIISMLSHLLPLVYFPP